jgi:hypothetical protein
MKAVQGWIQCEALASDAVKDHLDTYLLGIYSTSRQSATVFVAYTIMLEELALDDETVLDSLYSELDIMKQKERESMLEYVTRINVLKGKLISAETDFTQHQYITTKLGKKAYRGMNKNSAREFRGQIITGGAKNDFAKIKKIVEDETRDEHRRLATRGEHDQDGDHALSAQHHHRHQQQIKRNIKLGDPVPNKLYISNLKFTTTSKDLQMAFAQYGDVESAEVATKQGRPAGFGFVTFKTPDEAC